MRSSPLPIATRRVLLSLALAATTAMPATPSLAGESSHGPIYRTLDALAGGIEAVIDLAEAARDRSQRGGASSCDDGCDAVLVEELGQSPMHIHEYSSHPSPHAMSDDVLMPPDLMTPPQLMTPSSGDSVAVPHATPSPKLPTPPRDVPRAPRMAPQLAQPIPTPRNADEEWVENFSSESGKAPKLPTKTPAAPQRRSPAETYDSLPDPFSDDPQSRRTPRSTTQRATYNQPASYWEPW